jgi:hypothetical protein
MKTDFYPSGSKKHGAAAWPTATRQGAPALSHVDLERTQCEWIINEKLNYLACDAEARLEAHIEIGVVLLRAKKAEPKTFGKWCEEVFHRGREWRCTHMRLAERRYDLPLAREWAASNGLKVANYFSVDGSLELLQVYDVGTGRVTEKQKPDDTRNAKSSAGNSLHEFEVSSLKRELDALRDEARSFRKPLPSSVHHRAKSLLDQYEKGDYTAEAPLRAIAREHAWLFHDFCVSLRDEQSGPPDLSSPPPLLPAPGSAA